MSELLTSDYHLSFQGDAI